MQQLCTFKKIFETPCYTCRKQKANIFPLRPVFKHNWVGNGELRNTHCDPTKWVLLYIFVIGYSPTFRKHLRMESSFFTILVSNFIPYRKHIGRKGICRASCVYGIRRKFMRLRSKKYLISITLQQYPLLSKVEKF